MLIGVEWGKRGIMFERLEDIADALGVPLEDLVCPTDSDPTQS
jgi:hypothetical protein